MARHRHKGILGAIAQTQHDANKRRAAQMRAEAQHMRAIVVAQRQAEETRRTYERSLKADERERHRLYIEDRIAETDALNEDRSQQLATLSAILASTIAYGYVFDVHSLKEPLELPTFNPGMRPVKCVNRCKRAKLRFVSVESSNRRILELSHCQ